MMLLLLLVLFGPGRDDWDYHAGDAVEFEAGGGGDGGGGAIRTVAQGEAAHSVQGARPKDSSEVFADVALDVDGEVGGLVVDGRGEDFDRHAE